ncbi:MAG: hypothetical protein ACYSWU_11150 [Planctomycetota bacterium]
MPSSCMVGQFASGLGEAFLGAAAVMLRQRAIFQHVEQALDTSTDAAYPIGIGKRFCHGEAWASHQA